MGRGVENHLMNRLCLISPPGKPEVVKNDEAFPRTVAAGVPECPYLLIYVVKVGLMSTSS